MIFASTRTLLIKLICVGTASKHADLQIRRLDFWSMGAPPRDNFVRNLCFSTKSGYPPSGS